MNDDKALPPTSVEILPQTEDEARNQLADLNAGTYKKYARFVLAALSSVPWIGGVLGASAALHAEREQGRINVLFQQWLEEHRRKLKDLSDSLNAVTSRVEEISDAGVQERVQSEEYLGLVPMPIR